MTHRGGNQGGKQSNFKDVPSQRAREAGAIRRVGTDVIKLATEDISYSYIKGFSLRGGG